MSSKFKAELEAAVTQVIVRFEQEYMGRVPVDTHAAMDGELGVVRLRNVLSPAERALATSSDSGRGRDLVKLLYRQLADW